MAWAAAADTKHEAISKKVVQTLIYNMCRTMLNQDTQGGI